MAESERDYNNKIDLQFAGDNLPRLIEKLIPGMPIRLSGDEVKLLQISNECIQYEIERRSNLGRKRSETPSKAALKMRKSREKNAIESE